MKFLAVCQFVGGSLDGAVVPVLAAPDSSKPPRALWVRRCGCGHPGCTAAVLLMHAPPGEPYHLELDRYVAGPPPLDEFPVHSVHLPPPPQPPPAAESPSPMPDTARVDPLPYVNPPLVRWVCLVGLALVLLSVAARLATGQVGTVRVVNRTQYRHRNLAFCGATFPPGVVFAAQDGQGCALAAGEALGVPGAVASAVQPFGARWPDGSVRFGRVCAVLEVPALADVTLPLGPVPDVPFRLSPWTTAKAGRIFPAVLLTRPDGARQVSELDASGRAELLTANRAAIVVRFRQRIAGTPLLWEITFAFGSDTDAVQWWVAIHNSDPTVPDVRFDFTAIEFRTAQASAVYWREKLGIPQATLVPGVDAGYTGTIWRLVGQDWLGDAQGLSWFEGVTPLIDVANLDVPDVRKRSEAQQAVVTAPLEMMHSGWGTPGLYGPLGSCGALPEGVALQAADAAITAAGNAWAADRRAIGTWAELPWGEFSDTARTGEHPTHGVTKLADLCLTSNPLGLAERRLAWLGETRRPVCRFEADLSPVTKARHPQWIAWSGSTHYRVSQDKLGKPVGPTAADVHTWAGPDPEHWMGETLLAPLALITADWRLLEQGRHRMENLKGHGNLSLQSFAARSICWVSRAAAWWTLALGDPGDMQWTRAWLDYVVARHHAKWLGKTGPVQPWITMVDRRYFASPEREFWIIWQHQFLFGWLEAARVAEHAPALDLAVRISRLCDLEGWDPVTNRPFGGQATKPDAQVLTAAEKAWYVRDIQDPMGNWVKTDGMVTSSAQTDWDIWALASLDIGRHFATAANDQAWLVRNAALQQSVRATLTTAGRKAKAAVWNGAAPVAPAVVR